MAEWLVEPIVEKLIDTCCDYLKDQIRWQTGMKEELDRLRENLPKIQSVIFASNQDQIREQNPDLNKWLWQLRDAVEEADDVIDELEYMKLQKQLTENSEQRKVRSIMKSINKRLVKIAKRALKIDPLLKRLEEAVLKLDKVSVDVGNFLYLVKDAKQQQQEEQLELYRARETGSLPKNDQIGRLKEMEFVTQWLRNPSNEYRTTLYNNISLLSIVGLGGMGKTTLLQHVYKHEITEEFDLKIWVCVSNKFDVKRVIADTLESLKNERPRLETLDALQKSLESAVKSKKFLLVLDDIWEEEEERDKSKWEKVLAPLACGSMGSKILVTTRMESVAFMIAKVIDKKNETLRLEGLKEDECLQLLNKYAFANAENPNVHLNLRSITKKIVKRLCGSPLAARVTGGVLNSHLDERHWIRVLDYDIGTQDDIMSILKLSYIFLPQVLQNCFSYCSIFPQDYVFHKDDLIQMWIALGFIQSPYAQGETLKDAGGRYFDILVKKSLFDKFQINDKTYYKLHDLLHELIRSISAQECFSIVDDEELLFRIPKTIRHLFVQANDPCMLKKMGEFKNLRSLYLCFHRGYSDYADVLTKILKTSRSIRLLYLHARLLRQLPEEIGHLIHLRYLNIGENDFTLLPKSLSNLHHLQFININGLGIPRDMNNHPNLHYLKLPFPGMKEIGKLSSLQELHGFYVKDEVGYRIGELEHMNDLRLLRIKCLENVNDVEEACNAKLYEKRNLTDLSLAWGDFSLWDNHHGSIVDVALVENVLDNLQPYKGLKKLKMDSYLGAKSAVWMNNINLIFNLEYIKLKNCFEWQTLPPFGQLPLLKSLYLCNMPKAKRFDYKFHENHKHCVFPSLQMLYIEDLEELEDWFDARSATVNCLFPCLTELYLQGCPNLQELPSLPPKLEKLEIDGIGWKTLNWLRGTNNNCSISIENSSNIISLTGLHKVDPTRNYQLILSELVIGDPSMLLMEPLRSVTSMKKLIIKENDELVLFPNEVEQWFLHVGSSLCELEFTNLYSLQSLPSSLERLSSLEILQVKEVPQLQLLPNIASSLERLELVNIESLQSLPSSLESISSLKSLLVENVPQLQLLPNITTSLEQLELVNLESLQLLPSSLESLSSLKILLIENVPELQLLPNIPASLEQLVLKNLISLQSLSSSMENLSSLKVLRMAEVPELHLLPNFPASLEQLDLEKLESLQTLPSSSSFASLKHLALSRIPLRELPDPLPSLCKLQLHRLEFVDRLPSCLHSFPSLQNLNIHRVPQLRELPDLPPSMQSLSIINCHPELKERYHMITGSDWHKIAQIPSVYVR